MARITVEDCIDKFESRFELVLVASNRARKLHSGEIPTVDKDNDKNTVIALREIADETISIDEMKNNLISEYQTVSLQEEEEDLSLENPSNEYEDKDQTDLAQLNEELINEDQQDLMQETEVLNDDEIEDAIKEADISHDGDIEKIDEISDNNEVNVSENSSEDKL